MSKQNGQQAIHYFNHALKTQTDDYIVKTSTDHDQIHWLRICEET